MRLNWAKLLMRVFDLDLQHCPNCGGELKIIAAILEAPVIEKILTYLGLQARAPPRSPARGQELVLRDGQTVAECAAVAEALMQALGLACAERIGGAYLELLPR